MQAILTESSSARISRIVHGDLPAIRSFGILGGKGKNGEDHSEALAENLQDGNYGFIQIRGRYGKIEDPFLIVNMSKESCIEAVMQDEEGHLPFIFAEVDYGKGITFHYIEDGEATASRIVCKETTGNRIHFTTHYRGCKFSIPFFDEPDKGMHIESGGMPSVRTRQAGASPKLKELVAQLKETEILNPDTRQPVKISKALSFRKHSRSYRSAVRYILSALEKHKTVALDVLRTNLVDPNRLSFTLEEIDRLSKSKELLRDVVTLIRINKRDHSITTGKGIWMDRGRTLQIMSRLHTLFAALN